MARYNRVIKIGQPHHIVQRGNYGRNVFAYDSDARFYQQLLFRYLRECQVEVLAYVFMKNHVHFVMVPGRLDSFATLFRLVNGQYSKVQNDRVKDCGHFWQGRFYCKALQLGHLQLAIRYIENNPVHAGIVAKAVEYKWSSAPAHICGSYDLLLSPLGGWGAYLPVLEDWEKWLLEDPKLEVQGGGQTL